MSKIKTLILRTAGTNCDLETEYAFSLSGSQAKRVHVQDLIAGHDSLENYHILALPGGFSYGDDISAGKVLAVELRARLGDQMDRFIERGGLVIGICNGFQVLVKMGFLPRPISPSEQKFSLINNDCGRFEDRWVYLKPDSRKCVFVKDDGIIELPVAHGEGKFVAMDFSLIDDLYDNGQIVFRYVNADGSDAEFPANPNGSYLGVAGVCDETGRILGLMPHPERFISPYSHPRHTREGRKAEGDGVRVFRNAVEYVIERGI